MSIHENTGYDALSSNPLKIAESVMVPAIFLSAEVDEISPWQQVMQIFDSYGASRKKFHIMEGRAHREKRSANDIETAIQFLRKLLKDNCENPKADNLNSTEDLSEISRPSGNSK